MRFVLRRSVDLETRVENLFVYRVKVVMMLG